MRFDTGLLFRTLSWLLLRGKIPEAAQETWLQNVLADEALLSKTLRFMEKHMRIESVAGNRPLPPYTFETKILRDICRRATPALASRAYGLSIDGLEAHAGCRARRAAPHGIQAREARTQFVFRT